MSTSHMVVTWGAVKALSAVFLATNWRMRLSLISSSLGAGWAGVGLGVGAGVGVDWVDGVDGVALTGAAATVS